MRSLLERAGLPVTPPAVGAQRLFDAMSMDKKVVRKQLRLVLLNSLGDASVTTDFDEASLRRVLEAAG